MVRRQWHQLDHIQVICNSLQTDNHASISSQLQNFVLLTTATTSTANKLRLSPNRMQNTDKNHSHQLTIHNTTFTCCPSINHLLWFARGNCHCGINSQVLFQNKWTQETMFTWKTVIKMEINMVHPSIIHKSIMWTKNLPRLLQLLQSVSIRWWNVDQWAEVWITYATRSLWGNSVKLGRCVCEVTDRAYRRWSRCSVCPWRGHSATSTMNWLN